MALSQSTPFSSLLIPPLKHHLVGESRNRRTVILPTLESPRNPSISSFRSARSKPCSALRTISCVAFSGDISEDGTRESTSISSLFVKGLPDSVSEGRLRKVFSEFGQVCNVKIIINERTRQSLGYGYVWFNRKEDAELAVEAMNGKVAFHALVGPLWWVFKILLTKPCSFIPGLKQFGMNPKLSEKPTNTHPRVVLSS